MLEIYKGAGGAGTSQDCYGNPLDTKKSQKWQQKVTKSNINGLYLMYT